MSENNLRAGFYDPTQLRWTDCPQGISQAAWNDASQAGRRTMHQASYTEALPDATAMTPDELQQWISTCALSRYDMREREAAIDDEVAWGRTRQEILALRTRNPEAYEKRLADLPEAQQADFHRWEGIWTELNSDEYRQEQSQLTTAAKGLPAWGDIFRLGLEDVDHDSKYQHTLDQMDEEEQHNYYEWEFAQNSRLESFSTQLYDMFENGSREQHWSIYQQLTPVERVYYGRWLAAGLAEKTVPNAHIHRTGLVGDLYDTWIHTGEDQAIFWTSYVSNVAPMLGHTPKHLAPLRHLHNILMTCKSTDLLEVLGIRSEELQDRPLMSILGQFSALAQLEERNPGLYQETLGEYSDELRNAYHKWQANPDAFDHTRNRFANSPAGRVTQKPRKKDESRPDPVPVVAHTRANAADAKFVLQQ